MKFPLSTTVLLCACCQLAAAGCAQDNCLRAVTGTARQMSDIKYNDCQSFAQCTVTPVAAQTTVTVTATARNLAKAALHPHIKRDDGVLERRQSLDAITNCPTAIPSYASMCSGTVRYASACSCWGLTASTTTLASGATITQTTTMIVMPPPASDSPSMSQAPSGSAAATTLPSTVPTKTYVYNSGTTVVSIPTPTQFMTLKVKGGNADGESLVYSSDSKIEVAGPNMNTTDSIFFIGELNHLHNHRDPDVASFVDDGSGVSALSFTAAPTTELLNCTVDNDFALDCNQTVGYKNFRICSNYLYVTEDADSVFSGDPSSPCHGQPKVGVKVMFVSN